MPKSGGNELTRLNRPVMYRLFWKAKPINTPEKIRPPIVDERSGPNTVEMATITSANEDKGLKTLLQKASS